MNKDENRLFFRHGTGSLSIIFMVQQNIGKAKSSIILDNNKMKVMKVYYDSKLARLLTFMGSFDKDPADRFPALLGGKDGSAVAERAVAAAVPEEFVTALVSRALAETPLL